MFSSFKKWISSILIVGAIAVAGITFTPEMGVAQCDNYYVHVIGSDGTKWIYEYDCDGRIIDIYPDV
jgi:hypothetical protein